MSEREVLYGNENGGNQKPITAFHPLKTMEPNTEIEGRHIGRFESKKKEGVFFHLFENEAGEVHGYGSCKTLDERVNEYKAKCDELGLNPESHMMSTTFRGRLPNKTNSNTSYKFTPLVIFKPKAAPAVAASADVAGDDIPF